MSANIQPHDFHPDASIDLGDQGCGDLVMGLMKAIRPLAAGQVLHVHATDTAASIDIAAWCAMQSHTLLAGPAGEDHSDYYIQKGEKTNG